MTPSKSSARGRQRVACEHGRDKWPAVERMVEILGEIEIVDLDTEAIGAGTPLNATNLIRWRSVSA